MHVGSQKTLLTGDSSFYAEEILTGKVKDELEGKEGLEICEGVDKKGYLSLVEDLSKKEKLSKNELNSKYKLDRLNKKDLSAQILKKAHHQFANTTSGEFLNNVNPTLIVVSGLDYKTCKLIEFTRGIR